MQIPSLHADSALISLSNMYIAWKIAVAFEFRNYRKIIRKVGEEQKWK